MGDILETAFAAIRANKLRSIITISIIAVGIMSLVGIQTAIEVISSCFSDSFSRMGAESMAICEQEAPARPVSLAQARAFREAFDCGSSSASRLVNPVAQIRGGEVTTDPVVNVVAADDGWLQCSGNTLACGRNLPAEGRCCLIGGKLAAKLFGEDEALGRSVSDGKGRWRIVGVLATRGLSLGGNADNSLIIPATDDGSPLDAETGYTITLLPDIAPEAARDRATTIMRRIRRSGIGCEDDFVIRGSDSMAGTLEAIKSKLSTAALTIGIITLLGSAVCLMNIMLVSVKERRKEIGLRKAIGAPDGRIALQFLVEAAVIGQAGGIAGILAGLLGGNAVALILDGDFSIPWKWLAAALLICLCVSLLSGLLPARKAAALNPVDSLRHE